MHHALLSCPARRGTFNKQSFSVSRSCTSSTMNSASLTASSPTGGVEVVLLPCSWPFPHACPLLL